MENNHFLLAFYQHWSFKVMMQYANIEYGIRGPLDNDSVKTIAVKLDTIVAYHFLNLLVMLDWSIERVSRHIVSHDYVNNSYLQLELQGIFLRYFLS